MPTRSLLCPPRFTSVAVYWARAAVVSGLLLLCHCTGTPPTRDSGTRDASDVADAQDALICDGVVCHGGCETDTQTNISHCGPSCRVCPNPGGGIATCVDGSCVPSCATGFAPWRELCIAAPTPRPVRPITNSRVTVRNPTLHWVLPIGVDGVHARVCADRDCTHVEVEFDATGTSARVPLDLASGVWFWNLQSVTQGVRSSVVSPTWQFHTPSVSRPIDWSWADRPDLDGDGRDDLGVTTVGSNDGPAAYVLLGNAARSTDALIPIPHRPINAQGSGTHSTQLIHAGDTNGDGRTDLALIYGTDQYTIVTELFHGTPGGVATTPSRVHLQGLLSPAYGEPIGDLDGDGYSDAVLRDWSGIYWAHGGPDGWSDPVLLESGNIQSAIVADFNADGFDDIIMLTVPLQFWRGSANGPIEGAPVGTPEGSGWYLATVGDIDGDGYFDAIALSTVNGELAYTLIRGGVRGPALGLQSSSVAGAPVIGVLGDVNGDGISDIATFDTAHPSLVIHFGGQGRFDAGTTTFPVNWTEGSAYSRGLGDWDGDGLPDEAFSSGGVNGAGQVRIYLGNPGGAPPTTIDFSAPMGDPVTANPLGGFISSRRVEGREWRG